MGTQFLFPAPLRKEQGKMQQVRLKQQMTSNKLEQKQAELEAKIGNYYNELQTTDRQVALYEQIAQNYNRLLEAEQIKFNLGESSASAQHAGAETHRSADQTRQAPGPFSEKPAGVVLGCRAAAEPGAINLADGGIFRRQFVKGIFQIGFRRVPAGEI